MNKIQALIFCGFAVYYICRYEKSQYAKGGYLFFDTFNSYAASIVEE